MTLHCPHSQSEALVRNGRTSQPKGWSPLVARHRSFLALRPLLHRFLGCVPGGGTRGAACGGRLGNRANGTCRTLEHYRASTPGSLRPQNVVFSKSTRLHEVFTLWFGGLILILSEPACFRGLMPAACRNMLYYFQRRSL